jgi:DNA-binding MarR family transcriptional regulator
VSLILPPSPDPADRLAETLLRLAEELVRAGELHAQGRFGLSRTRLAVLLLLERSEDPLGQRPAEIAEALGVTRPSATVLLDGLQRDGLVARRADPADGRSVRVALTRAGRARAREIAPVHERRLAAMTRALDDPERRQLVALLEKVRSGLGALSGP